MKLSKKLFICSLALIQLMIFSTSTISASLRIQKEQIAPTTTDIMNEISNDLLNMYEYTRSNSKLPVMVWFKDIDYNRVNEEQQK